MIWLNEILQKSVANQLFFPFLEEARVNIAEHKLSLIRQIDQLPEESLIELEKLISQLQISKKPVSKRQFGCMKGLVISMADDFDAPLDDFKEYM